MKVTEVFWKNLKAYRDGFTTIINKGGTGSSKTVSIAQLVDFISAHSKKQRKSSVVSQTNDHLKRGFLYEYKRYMDREGFQRTHVPSYKEFRVENSIIEYFSLGDDPGRAVGPSRDILWLNEPNRGIAFESWVQLSQRTDEAAWIDYNPSHKWWLTTEGIINQPKTIVIHSTFLDNIENLSQKRIDYFKNAKLLSKESPYWDYWWKVYGLGLDGILLEERIMPFLRKTSKVPDDAIEIPSYLDFGWFPHPTSFGRLWVRRGNLKDELYIQQVVYDTKLNINAKGEGAKNLCDILIERGIDKRHLIIAECAEPRAVQDMKNAGFNVTKVSKTSVETTIRNFHEYDIYFVDSPWGNESYDEFDTYRYDRDKKTNEILEVPAKGQPDHSVDGVRYVLQYRGTRWSV